MAMLVITRGYMILYVVLIQESADLIRETKVFNIRLIGGSSGSSFHFPIDGPILGLPQD
jgi:hypothetical protein